MSSYRKETNTQEAWKESQEEKCPTTIEIRTSP